MRVRTVIIAAALLALIASAPSLHGSTASSWKIEVSLPKGGALLVKPVVYKGFLTVFMPDNSSLLGVRAVDGVLVFNASFPREVSNYAVIGDSVVVLSGNNLYVYRGGEERLLGTLPNSSFSQLTTVYMPVVRGTAFLPLNHSLAIITPSGYRVASMRTDIQYIRGINGLLAVAYTNNTVALLDPSSLKALWRTTLSLGSHSGIFLLETGDPWILGISAATIVNATATHNAIRGYMILVNASSRKVFFNATLTDEFPVASMLLGDKLYIATYQPITRTMGLSGFLLGSRRPFLNKTLSLDAGVPVFLRCGKKLRILLYTHYYNVTALLTQSPTKPMIEVYSSEGSELHRYIVSTEAQIYMQIGGFKVVNLGDKHGVIMVYMPYTGIKPIVLFYVPRPDICLVSRMTEGYGGIEALYAASIVAAATLASLFRRQGGAE